MVSKRLFERVSQLEPAQIADILRVVDTVERLIALAMVLIVALVVVVVTAGCSGNVTANWEGTDLPPISILSMGKEEPSVAPSQQTIILRERNKNGETVFEK